MTIQTTYGFCKICGCTANNPCHNPRFGFCWWADESETLCSHCASEEIRNDKNTVHCVNDISDWEEPEETEE